MNSVLSDQHVPRGALRGAAAVVLFTLAVTAGARILGVGFTSPPTAAALESRALRFEDRSDGAVLIHDARDGATVAVLAPGTNGFVRGAMRGLARERRRHGFGPEEPFELTRFADGRLALHDAATGHRMELNAFGSTNAQDFARLLVSGSVTP